VLPYGENIDLFIWMTVLFHKVGVEVRGPRPLMKGKKDVFEHYDIPETLSKHFEVLSEGTTLDQLEDFFEKTVSQVLIEMVKGVNVLRFLSSRFSWPSMNF